MLSMITRISQNLQAKNITDFDQVYRKPKFCNRNFHHSVKNRVQELIFVAFLLLLKVRGLIEIQCALQKFN